jgi:hypothetical protein
MENVVQATAAKLNTSPMEDPMQTLAHLSVARQVAAAAVEEALAAERRGKAATLDDEQHLARLELDHDNRMAEASAEQIKSGRPISQELMQQDEQIRTARRSLEVRRAGLAHLERDRAEKERVHQEASTAHTLTAMKVMLLEASTIPEKLNAAHRDIWAMEDQLRGLDFALSVIARTVPQERVTVLVVELRRLLMALQPPKRPYVPGLQAEYNQRVMQPWLEKFKELTK